MTNEYRKKKRILVSAKKPTILQHTDIIPAVDLLLHDAKCVISAELARYRTKVTSGLTLDLKEARIIQGYMDVILKLSKEEREASRAEDLSNLTDEELLDLAGKVLGTTKPKLAEEPN